MSNRFAVLFSLVLLAVSFLVPAFLSGWVRASTPHQYYGWPVFVRLELSPVFEADKFYRVFQSLTITPALFFYMLVPLAGGFLAGRIWPRRHPDA